MINTPSSPSHTFDVVILGGGPSGTAAGMTLLKRDGVSVAIIEKSDYSTVRVGESLTPGIRPLLEYLDLWHPFQQEQSLDAFGSRAAWGSPTPHTLDYMFTLHGTGWSLDRARFDQLLAQTFAARGGHLFTQTRFLRCDRTTTGTWQVQLSDSQQQTQTINGRYLIDATGRHGLLAKRLGAARVVHDRLVGVACIGQLPSEHTLDSAILVEACPYGWWYSAPIPGNRVSVVLMSGADIVSQLHATRPQQWQTLLADMPLTSERVASATFSNTPKAFLAFSSRLRDVGGDGWVAVGDAVASHDPLSSSGIPHAMGSGVQGALVAANALFGSGEALPHYQQAIFTDFNQYLSTRWQYYQRETRWPDSPFWQRRTTPIALDPHAIIAPTSPSPSQIRQSVHLPLRLAQQLPSWCQPGQAAHEVVRSFGQAHPQLPDQQIILGLQELKQNGRLQFI